MYSKINRFLDICSVFFCVYVVWGSQELAVIEREIRGETLAVL